MSAPSRVVDPREPLGRERRPGRADRPQRGQVAAGGRLDLRLHARREVRRARPERRRAGRLREVPQPVEVRRARVAVEQHDRRVGQQHGDEEVPHHPAGGGEPEHPVARLRSPGAGTSSSGARAGSRPGPARSPSGARWCRTSRAPTAGGRTAPARTPAHRRRGSRPPSRCRRGSRAGRPARRSPRRSRRPPRGGRSPCRRSGSRRPPAAPWARSARSGRPRCARRTRARPRTRPRRARRSRGTRRRSPARSAGRRRRGRPRPTPRATSPARIRGGLRAQLAPRPLAQLAQLGLVHDRDAVVGLAAEHALGVVELRAREPHRAGHRRVRQHPLVRAARGEAVPHRRPEALEVVDGPLPQRRVVRGPAVRHEPRHVRSLAQRGRRFPQQRARLASGAMLRGTAPA